MLKATEREVGWVAAFRFNGSAGRSFAGTRDNVANLRLKYDLSHIRVAYFLHKKGVSQ